MKKPTVLLLVAVFIVSMLYMPTVSAGSVSVSISGEQNVKPGHTYTYTYTISLNETGGFFAKIKCNGAEISGDKNPHLDSITNNSSYTVSGQVSVKISDSAIIGDNITISTQGRYTVFNEEGIPNLGGEISESYTLTVVGEEVPTPVPTPPPSEPISSETAPPAPLPPQEPKSSPTPKPIAHPSAKPSHIASASQPAQTYAQMQSDEQLPTIQPSNSAASNDLISISSQLDLMPQGGTVVVSMNAITESTLPALTLRVLKAKRGTMIIDFNEYTCTIDGNKLASTIDSPVNLYMNMTKNQKVSDAAEGHDIYQLHFSEESDFPGCLVYKIPAVENQPGDILYIYQYHAISGINEYKQTVTVDDNGHTSFNIYEGGSYFISASLITDNPKTGDTPVKAQNGSDLLYIIIPASCVILAAAVIIAALIIRKTASTRYSPNR